MVGHASEGFQPNWWVRFWMAGDGPILSPASVGGEAQAVRHRDPARHVALPGIQGIYSRHSLKDWIRIYPLGAVTAGD